jgi:GDP-D-mannose 3',5'-epimerase
MSIVVTGAGGFVGHHLVKFLKKKGHKVFGMDLKYPEFESTYADEFTIIDLRKPSYDLFHNVNEVYHLAADMGGIYWIENHKAEIVFNNTMINMLTLKSAQEHKVKKFLFTSSACVYPSYLQNRCDVKELKEEDAYPADSEDGYGWEKLMMERACRHFRQDYGLQTYIARFHNIYGPEGTYDGGREKSPAALCRKVALAKDEIEIWGNGEQTRSYCYVDDCVEALYNLMNSEYHSPLNIGTNRLVSINELADIIIKISGKEIRKTYDFNKPIGVVGRNADITKAKGILNWEPKVSLEEGLKKTYSWIKSRISQ